MKILLVEYDPNWIGDFEKIKRELLGLIGVVNPKIEHIGSTSIKELSAKPIIDILVGVDSEMVLEETIIPLTRNGYIYYECFNKQMPYRRFFVKHKIGFKPPQFQQLLQTMITFRQVQENIIID